MRAKFMKKQHYWKKLVTLGKMNEVEAKHSTKFIMFCASFFTFRKIMEMK